MTDGPGRRMAAFDQLPRAVQRWLDEEALDNWDPIPMVRQWQWARSHGQTEAYFLHQLQEAERRERRRRRR